MTPSADYLGQCRALVAAVEQQQSAIQQAADWFADLDMASASAVKMKPRIFEPNPATAAAYADGYRRYRQAFDALEPTFEPGSMSR